MLEKLKNLDENTKRILRGVAFVAVMLFSGYFIFNYFALRNQSTIYKNTITTLQKEIISKDTTIQIIKGKYSKLVNTFATTAQLKDQAEKGYKLLSDTIKRRNEQILSITTANVKFDSKHGTTTDLVKVKGDSTFTFTSYYPKKDNYMAKFTGDVNLNTKKVGENWDFQKFNLGIILTQREDGLWDYYIDAPEYATVSNIKVNSLPPVKYTPVADKPKTFGLWGGGGVRTNLLQPGSNNSLVFKAGISYKDKIILTGDAATDKTVGLGLLIRL